MTVPSDAVAEAYATKGAQYFAGARIDWVNQLAGSTTARILEIGCGNGDTGAVAIACGKCGFYAGVEIHEPAAHQARLKVHDVVWGNVEHVPLPYEPRSFDVLFISEVLEHLVEPARVLQGLGRYLRPGAFVFASSPNVSHYRVLAMLLAGRWDTDDKGTMDRTHLRWFTPLTYRRMFEGAGYAVDAVGPVTAAGPKTKVANFVTFGRCSHLFMRQINLRGHML